MDSILRNTLMILAAIGVANPTNADDTVFRKSDTHEYDFVRPYLRDWFVGRFPEDRSFGDAFIEAVYPFAVSAMANPDDLTEIRTTCDKYQWSERECQTLLVGGLLYNVDSPNEGTKLYFSSMPGKPASFYLILSTDSAIHFLPRISDVGIRYQAVPLDAPMLGVLKGNGIVRLERNEGLRNSDDVEFSQLVDVDGDGIKDLFRFSVKGFMTNTATIKLEVIRNTGITWIPEDQIENFILNMRLGYISAYYFAIFEQLNESDLSSTTEAKPNWIKKSIEERPTSNLNWIKKTNEESPAWTSTPVATKEPQSHEDAEDSTHYEALGFKSFFSADAPIRFNSAYFSMGTDLGWYDGSVQTPEYSKVSCRSKAIGDLLIRATR